MRETSDGGIVAREVQQVRKFSRSSPSKAENEEVVFFEKGGFVG